MKISTLIITTALLAHAALAAADDETAPEAFKRGQAALKAKEVREACEAFATSQQLQPKVETELALADCYVQEGKLVTAARMYRFSAEKDKRADRAKKSNQIASKLEAKAPRLRFVLASRPDGLVIKVDGVDVSAAGDVPVDFGPHQVVASAPGFEDATALPGPDGSLPIIEVPLQLTPKSASRPEAPPEVKPEPKREVEPEEQPQPMTRQITTDVAPSHRKRNGIIVGVAGLGLVATAGVFLGLASSKFSTERDLCPNGTCASPTDLARANALLDNGTTLRNVGIGVGIGGVALIAVGSYLMLTSPREAPRVSAQVTNDSTAVTFSGSF